MSKNNAISQNFRAAAAIDGEGALAYMLMSAFGISLDAIIGIARRIIRDKDYKAFIMTTASAVQVRSNVTFVGSDFVALRSKYPELVIEGERGVSDIVNFGAMRSVGHLLCEWSTNPLARQVLDKAGSCITGQGVNDSEAGRINLETSRGWSRDDIASFRAEVLSADEQKLLDLWFEETSKRAKAFSQQLNGGAKASKPTVPPKAGGAPPNIE